jgi:hypothetical protein
MWLFSKCVSYLLAKINNNSNIPSVCQAREQKGAGLLHSVYSDLFLRVILCYCCWTWTVHLIRRVYHLDISFFCYLRIIRILLCVVCRRRRSGDTTTVDTQPLSRAFLNMSSCFIGEAFFFFLVKSKTRLGSMSSGARALGIYELSDVRLKEFYCIFIKVHCCCCCWWSGPRAKAPVALQPLGVLYTLFSRSSHCRRQMSLRPTRRERSKHRDVEL